VNLWISLLLGFFGQSDFENTILVRYALNTRLERKHNVTSWFIYNLTKGMWANNVG
jgi:hypothetical protein